jgi:hypothetical protein
MKRVAALAALVASLALAGIASAAPTTGPEPGPGCFGQWRAGSVQWINENGLGPAGKMFFSVRKDDNAELNAAARELCASLTP